MKKNLLLCMFIMLVFTSCSILDMILDSQEESILNLKSQIISLKFTVKKLDANNMVIDYEFYNLSGEKIGKSNSVKLRGSELFIDCRVEKLNSKVNLVFPHTFYSNLVPLDEGIVIMYDYNNDDYPEIFTGVKKSEARKIQKLYYNILQDTATESSFRSSPHILITEKEENYNLVSRVRGGIEILKAENNR